MIWVDYLILVVVILLILTVAIQEAQDNISDAFSGEKSDLLNKKTRGFELFNTFHLCVRLSIYWFNFFIFSLTLKSVVKID